MTNTIKAIYCPYRFTLPNTNQQYCIGHWCHAYEEVNKGPSYVTSKLPYCHTLGRFLQESRPDGMME